MSIDEELKELALRLPIVMGATPEFIASLERACIQSEPVTWDVEQDVNGGILNFRRATFRFEK